MEVVRAVCEIAMESPQLLEPEALREVAGRRLDKKVLVSPLSHLPCSPSLALSLSLSLYVSLCFSVSVSLSLSRSVP